LSPVSADPTLTYVRIPWIFRLPPDLAVQSKVIAEQGIAARSLEKIGLLTSTDHDGRIFSKEMIAWLRNIQVTPKFHFEISSSGLDINELILRLNSYEIEALVIYLPPSVISTIIAGIQQSDRHFTIILPWIPGMKTVEIADLYDGDLYSVRAFSESANTQYAIFTEAFLRRYGMHPPPDAAYTYDAVQLLVHSLLKSGLNRSLLREEIASIGTYQGITGTICWDNGGGNRVEPSLEIIKGVKDK
jgi:ABC-type branched-subunit amino acid transport system substrate-binding protein